MNNIKAIIFDWGGVCCAEGEPYASLELQKNLQKTPDEIQAEMKDVYCDFYRGKYTNEEFWNKVLDHFGLEETDTVNSKSLGGAYLNSYTLWQDVLDIAKQLQTKYKVGLLSDLTPIMRDHIRQSHNVAEYFSVEVYSCDKDVCVRKTDGPEIFNIIVKKLGVLPQECLFIDNSKDKIESGKRAGLNTLWFQNRGQFFKDIKIFL